MRSHHRSCCCWFGLESTYCYSTAVSAAHIGLHPGKHDYSPPGAENPGCTSRDSVAIVVGADAAAFRCAAAAADGSGNAAAACSDGQFYPDRVLDGNCLNIVDPSSAGRDMPHAAAGRKTREGCRRRPQVRSTPSPGGPLRRAPGCRWCHTAAAEAAAAGFAGYGIGRNRALLGSDAAQTAGTKAAEGRR